MVSYFQKEYGIPIPIEGEELIDGTIFEPDRIDKKIKENNDAVDEKEEIGDILKKLT